jgi:intracellular sulfur oxidation DsrE/DsrF family protein
MNEDSIMKTFILTSLIFSIHLCCAQNKTIINGAAIKNYGNTLPVVDAELHLNTNTHYKVIFDIAKSPDEKGKLNSSINTIARFINMHVSQGVPLENLEIIAVIHGAAVKDYTTNQTYLNKHGVANPNIELISQLEEVGAKSFMCGQSFGYRGYTKNQLSENAQLALSAMTALIYFQSEGFQLINFN